MRPPGDETPQTGLEGPDAQLLADIENLQLTARTVAHGALAGMHRSLRRGASIEFSEHKLYSPGDDIRHIDWRAFAKTDRYHVKQFEDETNLRLELLVDHSGSMAFADGGRPSKLAYARNLASALSYVALRQGDSTGLFTFAAQVTDELPARASSGHLMEILSRLAKLRAEGPTGIARCIDRFAQARGRRAVAVVLTDLFDPDPHLIDAFRRLAARRHDVAVLHLLDPTEIDFNYDAPSFFVSMEDTRRLFVHPRTLRSAFVNEMRAFLTRTARALSEASIFYHPVHTDTPPAQALAAFLRSREQRR
jgi:uncharacterized protein (DUF58 family)